jgi:hypothetical protein
MDAIKDLFSIWLKVAYGDFSGHQARPPAVVYG